jgi:hypothetical protein
MLVAIYVLPSEEHRHRHRVAHILPGRLLGAPHVLLPQARTEPAALCAIVLALGASRTEATMLDTTAQESHRHMVIERFVGRVLASTVGPVY